MRTLLAMLFFHFIWVGNSLAAELRIKIDNLKDPWGDYHIFVHNFETYTLKEQLAFKKKVVKVERLTTRVKFSALPPGSYAIFVFQDKNNNQKLDKNIFWIPREPFAFSNKAKKKGYARAKWKKIRFYLTEEGTEQVIDIN